jgi:hypothetical protein
VVTVEYRAGGKASQIGSRSWLTHAKGRGHLRAQDGNRPPVLLLLGAERQQRCRDDAHALRVEAVVDAPPGKFLTMNELLQDSGVPATEFWGISR